MSSTVITADQFLAILQGNRRLTRKVMAAFPADAFTTFSVGGMRPMGGIARELLAMGGPMIRGFATDEWTPFDMDRTPLPQADVLAAWDANTAIIDAHWAGLVAKGFDREVTLYGQWTFPVRAHLQYILENEIHHRAQGYAYLRALGIEPPPFWER